MKWLRRRSDDGGPVPSSVGGTLPGRATIAPASTRKYGETFDDHTDWGSFTPNEMLWVETSLTPVSAQDGQPVQPGLQTIKQSLPIWMVSVLYHAGTNNPLASELPPSVDVPVLLDAAARRITGIDVAVATLELEPYREAAVRYFKRTDSWLAPIRGVASFPVDAVNAAKSTASEWKAALGSMSDQGSSWSASDIEAMRRNATILALRWQKKPKEREKGRRRALQALAMNAENVRAGNLPFADFQVLVMCEEVSTAITPEEAAAFRNQCGPAQR